MSDTKVSTTYLIARICVVHIIYLFVLSIALPIDPQPGTPTQPSKQFSHFDFEYPVCSSFEALVEVLKGGRREGKIPTITIILCFMGFYQSLTPDCHIDVETRCSKGIRGMTGISSRVFCFCIFYPQFGCNSFQFANFRGTGFARQRQILLIVFGPFDAGKDIVRHFLTIKNNKQNGVYCCINKITQSYLPKQ